MQESATATTTIVIRLVGIHLNEVFLAHNSLDDIPQVIGNRIAVSLANQLTGILNRKLDLSLFIPIGTDLQLTLAKPLGVKLNDALDFKVVLNLEFFESDPDCKKFVPSLGVEPDLAPEIIHRFGLYPHNFFPVFVVGHKQAVIFRGPPLGAVSPVRTN